MVQSLSSNIFVVDIQRSKFLYIYIYYRAWKKLLEIFCVFYFVFPQSLVSGWGGHYSFRCQPVDYSHNPIAMRMARGCWWYYISKFVEFTDTIFFVLRKKNDHISTLHVIHHGCMPMSVWFGVKFTPGKRSIYFLLFYLQNKIIILKLKSIYNFIIVDIKKN